MIIILGYCSTKNLRCMKTRTSIKSTEIVSSFQSRLGLNKSGIKSFVSAIRNNSLQRIKDKQLE